MHQHRYTRENGRDFCTIRRMGKCHLIQNITIQNHTQTSLTDEGMRKKKKKKQQLGPIETEGLEQRKYKKKGTSMI